MSEQVAGLQQGRQLILHPICQSAASHPDKLAWSHACHACGPLSLQAAWRLLAAP
jgi:hypothetical protein